MAAVPSRLPQLRGPQPAPKPPPPAPLSAATLAGRGGPPLKARLPGEQELQAAEPGRWSALPP